MNFMRTITITTVVVFFSFHSVQKKLTNDFHSLIIPLHSKHALHFPCGRGREKWEANGYSKGKIIVVFW